EALSAGVVDGTIDAICSDHAPVDDDARLMPFAEAEAGATALELLLPLTLQWAAARKLALADALACITTRPAAVLGLPAPSLADGMPADVCIFDPALAWTVHPGALRSQGKNTPFLGLEVVGRVRATLLAGHVVHDAA